jgi:membrane peptidoglycan carboxypeptidase
MPKERITRRQKDVSRLLREKKKIQRDQLKKFKKKKLYLGNPLKNNIQALHKNPV